MTKRDKFGVLGQPDHAVDAIIRDAYPGDIFASPSIQGGSTTAALQKTKYPYTDLSSIDGMKHTLDTYKAFAEALKGMIDISDMIPSENEEQIPQELSIGIHDLKDLYTMAVIGLELKINELTLTEAITEKE